MPDTVVCDECKGTGHVKPFDILADENWLRVWEVCVSFAGDVVARCIDGDELGGYYLFEPQPRSEN